MSLSAGAAPRASDPLLLAALFLAVFAAAAGTHALTPIFPELKAAFGVDEGAVRLLTSAFTLGYGGAGFLLGALADRLGRRRVLAVTLLVYAVTSAMLVLPVGYGGALALRAAAGVATGGIGAAALALVADRVAYARRGRAMALVLSGSFAAVVLAVPLAAWLARVHVLAIGPVLALFAALALGLLAARQATDDAPAAPPGTGWLARPTAALRARGAGPALLTTFCNTAATFAVLTSLADHAKHAFGQDLGDRAVFFLWLGLGALPGVAVSGLIADRLGKRRTVLLAIVLSILATPLLLVPRTAGAFLAVALAGTALAALRQGPFAAILSALGDGSARAALLGWNSAASGAGLALGAWLGGEAYSIGAAGAGAMTGAVIVAEAALLISWMSFGLGVPEPAAAHHAPAAAPAAVAAGERPPGSAA